MRSCASVNDRATIASELGVIATASVRLFDQGVYVAREFIMRRVALNR